MEPSSGRTAPAVSPIRLPDTDDPFADPLPVSVPVPEKVPTPPVRLPASSGVEVASAEPPERPPEVRVNLDELAASIAGTNLALDALEAELDRGHPWDARRLGPVADRLKSYPYLFRVYLGGGTMLYNREERVYAYGVVRTSLMFAALPYMAAGFTLEMGFWRDPDSQQLYFVIPLHATIRVGPEVGPVQPYMGFSGVGLWLGERLGPTFTVGGELLGGVEIRPFDRRRLGFHLGLGGGYVDGLMFNANLGVTAQW